jgi:hypothetical protein
VFTCVGVPAYAPVAGGSPGAPTSIRTVTTRASDNAMLAPRTED